MRVKLIGMSRSGVLRRTKLEDWFTTVGADGHVTRSKNHDRSGRLVLDQPIPPKLRGGDVFSCEAEADGGQRFVLTGVFADRDFLHVSDISPADE